MKYFDKLLWLCGAVSIGVMLFFSTLGHATDRPVKDSFIYKEAQADEKFYASHTEFRLAENRIETSVRTAAAEINQGFHSATVGAKLKLLDVMIRAMTDLKFSEPNFKENFEFKVHLDTDQDVEKYLKDKIMMVGIINTKYKTQKDQVGWNYAVIFEAKRGPVVFVKLIKHLD